MNPDYEAIIDKRVSQAIKWHKGSDAYVKYAMIAASCVVGKYDEGATIEIARCCKRSLATIQNWAHGHWLYRDLRVNGKQTRVRTLWRSLPASHWWQAWDIHKNGYDAYFYLNNADLNGWSGRDMMFEYRCDREAGNAPLVFSRMVLSLCGLVAELEKSKSITDKQRAALAAVRKAFE